MSCADELRGLGEVQKVLKQKGGTIIAISADKVERLVEGRKDNPDLPCKLASDADGQAIRALHLLHEKLGKIGKTLAVPANILVDQAGVVRWAHYAGVVMDRPDPKLVLQKVLAVGSNAGVLSSH